MHVATCPIRCTYLVFVLIELVLSIYMYLIQFHWTCYDIVSHCVLSTLANTHCNVCKRTVCNSTCIILSCALTSCTFLTHTHTHTHTHIHRLMYSRLALLYRLLFLTTRCRCSITVLSTKILCCNTLLSVHSSSTLNKCSS